MVNVRGRREDLSPRRIKVTGVLVVRQQNDVDWPYGFDTKGRIFGLVQRAARNALVNSSPAERRIGQQAQAAKLQYRSRATDHPDG